VIVSQSDVRTVRWHLPGLLERPAVGTSCCATTAVAIVVQELSLQPGIEDVAIDDATGDVCIVFRPQAVDEATLADALDEVGYPPAHLLATK
jgi:hypothetical protein